MFFHWALLPSIQISCFSRIRFRFYPHKWTNSRHLYMIFQGSWTPFDENWNHVNWLLSKVKKEMEVRKQDQRFWFVNLLFPLFLLFRGRTLIYTCMWLTSLEFNQLTMSHLCKGWRQERREWRRWLSTTILCSHQSLYFTLKLQRKINTFATNKIWTHLLYEMHHYLLKAS